VPEHVIDEISNALYSISELIWELEDRTSGTLTPDVTDEERLLYDMDDVTDDVVESLEEEIPYIFPARPPPEEE